MSLFQVLWIVSLLVAASQAGVIGHSSSASESHDFSEGLANSASSHYESLGSLGDHLDQSHFPSDFGESHQGDEYSERSDHIEIGAPSFEHEHNDFSQHNFEHDFHSALHDFDTKPVPGINHGKGALSYSTTYEFQDHKP